MSTNAPILDRLNAVLMVIHAHALTLQSVHSPGSDNWNRVKRITDRAANGMAWIAAFKVAVASTPPKPRDPGDISP